MRIYMYTPVYIHVHSVLPEVSGKTPHCCHPLLKSKINLMKKVRNGNMTWATSSLSCAAY